MTPKPGACVDHESINTVDLAMDAAGETDAAAGALLEVQAQLTRAQLRQLGLQIYNDRLLLAMRLLMVAAAVAAAVAVGVWLWLAAHDHGLVVEEFSAPSDLAAQGLSGRTVAARVLDRLITLQEATVSLRAPDSYATNWGKDRSLQIGGSGVSVNQLDRAVRDVLGDRTHITGEVYRPAPGQVTVAVRAGSRAAVSFTGREDQIEGLITQAAEGVYAQTQPFRYANHLRNTGRYDAAIALFRHMSTRGPAQERAWAQAGLAYTYLLVGDASAATKAGEKATRLDPDLPAAWLNRAAGDYARGDTEAFLSNNRKALAALQGKPRSMEAPVAAAMRASLSENIATDLGDFEAAARHAKALGELSEGLTIVGGEAPFLRAADLAAAGDVAGARSVLADYPEATDAWIVVQPYLWTPHLPGVAIAEATGDWVAGLPALKAAVAAAEAGDAMSQMKARVYLRPWLAYALAKTGDVAGARVLVAGFPAGCVLCARVAGRVADLANDRDGANKAFARAVRLAPSSPFAATDWAAMLLRRGDAAGAVAKAQAAVKAGPRSTSALSLLVQALEAQGRKSEAEVVRRRLKALQGRG